ncbi:uncharacterized protein LOC121374303 isoform X2 [Gigantopelta aegis]|nr:uncharacterized protein LOC121374303 isoform X2 [Gigantopelta aegis]
MKRFDIPEVPVELHYEKKHDPLGFPDVIEDDTRNIDSAFQSGYENDHDTLSVDETAADEVITSHHIESSNLSRREAVVDQAQDHDGRLVYGSKEDINTFINKMMNSNDGSGVILERFSSILKITSGNYIDFTVHEPLQDKIDVCEDGITKKLFIKKKVPIEQFMARKQEVEIPLQYQDCKWMVQIYGLKKPEDDVIILMEYCAGGTIEDIAHTDMWSSSHWLMLTEQLLEALVFLQNQDICHGDIKLSNLLLRNSDDPKSVCITDWESAKTPFYKINNRVTLTHLPPWYSKHCSGQGQWTDDRKSMDNWSLGLSICSLITGQQPWARLHELARNCGNCPEWQRVCAHNQRKIINYISENPNEISDFYPDEVETGCGHVLTSVIKGLLPTSGRMSDQWNADFALDVLQGRVACPVQVQIFLDGRIRYCIWTESDTKFKSFLKKPEITSMIEDLKLKDNRFMDGYYFKQHDGDTVPFSFKIIKDVDFDICPSRFGKNPCKATVL